jgi:SARP family transcriptional regulator, regulator of embCAB operon
MVGAHVVADLGHDVLVGFRPSDEAALAGDLLGHVRSFVRGEGWDYVGGALAGTRLQLCGKLVVDLEGERVEEQLPGKQGRLLLAFLVTNRNRALTRDEAVDALWPDGRDGGLAPLLSKLRRVVPLDGLRVVLPPDARVDVEAAVDAVHRAESALAQDDPRRAWGPAQVAMFVTERPFLAGDDAPWIDEMRRRLTDVRVRAIEAYARAGLGIGGTELPAAERAGRELVRLEPYRESGYRVLMEALGRSGNTAEALRVYDRLRTRLRDDLGVAPSAQTQDVYRSLLG